MITKILKQAFVEKKLIGITTKKIDWDESIIGYIIDINDDNLTIKEIDQYGKYIGNTIIPFIDICYVESQHRYMGELLFIHNNNHIFNPNLRETIWKNDQDLIPYFQSLKDSNKVIRIFFDDEYFAIGKVLDFNHQSLLIKKIMNNGFEDGNTCYRIKDIIGYRYDGLQEQKIKLLLDLKNK